MTHLVVQAPVLADADLSHLQTLVQARRDIDLAPHALRMTDVRDDAETRAAVKTYCTEAGIDWAFVEPGARLKDWKVLAMDMDSTLISIECIDEIADMAGLKAQVSAITEAAMRGEITDFKDSLRRRVALLRGLPLDALQQVYIERLKLNPGAERLVSTARDMGVKTLLVSGGFTWFTGRLKERLNLDAAYANTLSVDAQGRLTGDVDGDILDAQAKADHLVAFAKLHGALPSQAIAMGDGANDLTMMGVAGLSVAYHAKPVVRDQATRSINVCGLDSALNWFEDTAGR
ncbi:phosphoserine phosphatase SerB [Pigmentiphaga litoralis]|uniref:Phosphoserine phosphatase n=1 Tax=Pigmentiphaga litoralis TaxID=516702 RepID=A0A7Y9LPQ1_9BURK|nr:phosphoserine phosphatase SerB [Pigmentiphaga litoralis]NYE22024.1 phosphoserine phosphatase [Pigmentiphaga litoralis]NYE84361.1 phosphoserine phosphatase [Pigmentiphaga litoralis]